MHIMLVSAINIFNSRVKLSDINEQTSLGNSNVIGFIKSTLIGLSYVCKKFCLNKISGILDIDELYPVILVSFPALNYLVFDLGDPNYIPTCLQSVSFKKNAPEYVSAALEFLVFLHETFCGFLYVVLVCHR